jgi:outer membrane protein assembly factor BamB
MRKLWQSIVESNQMLMSFAISCVLLFGIAQGQEWTRFRGPNGQGISSAKTIPIKWTENDYNWKVKLPGGGHSSPVLWGDKVFITVSDPNASRGILLALSVSDGKVLWQKEYALKPYRMNTLNSFASATPAVDANCVYAVWPTAEITTLVAVSHSGDEVWKQNLAGVHRRHGAGSSPIVVDDIVVFAHEQEPSDSNVESVWMGFDCKTGKERWTVKRKNSVFASYSTPCVYFLGPKIPQLIFQSCAHGLTAIEPRSGAVLWEVVSAFTDRVVSSPVIAGELIIGTCGEGGTGKRMIAIQPAKDNSSPPKEKYKIEASSVTYVPTSVAAGELLFTFHDQGQVSCLRSTTGEQLWREKPAGRFFGSPVWVDGRLYCITTAGDVVVIKAADKYDLLAINPLGEKSHATPAVADGRMYLRTYSHLISIGGQKK